MRAKLRLTLFASSLLLPLAVASTGCTSYSKLGSVQRGKVHDALRDEPRFVASSMWYGAFYGDSAQHLVSPRAFSSLRHIQDLDGKIIQPPPALGIIPAGSIVVVKDVVFPTGIEVFWRSFDSPRYHPWVELHIPDVPSGKSCVLVLDNRWQTAEELFGELDALLTLEDVGAWLDTRPPEIRAAITAKKVIAGMETADLHAAMGHPDQVLRGGSSETWVYPELKVVVEEGKVVSSRETAAVPKAAPEPKAEPAASPTPAAAP